jgi:hypothetical protein
MCLAVYIASDAELPLIPFVEGTSPIHVQIDPPETVPLGLQRKHVVYIGAHEGCGCGFFTGGLEPGSVEHVAAMRSLGALAEYVASVARRSDLDMFACWEGAQHHEPVLAGEVKPDFFRFDSQPFDAAHDKPIQYAVRRAQPRGNHG